MEALTVELTPYKEQLRQLEIQLEGRTLNLDSMKIELEKYQVPLLFTVRYNQTAIKNILGMVTEDLQ